MSLAIPSSAHADRRHAVAPPLPDYPDFALACASQSAAFGVASWLPGVYAVVKTETHGDAADGSIVWLVLYRAYQPFPQPEIAFVSTFDSEAEAAKYMSTIHRPDKGMLSLANGTQWVVWSVQINGK